MHAAEMAHHALASKFLARCRGGFVDHFEWMGWRKKHAAEIESLPLNLRNAVTMAWDNACTPEASR